MDFPDWVFLYDGREGIIGICRRATSFVETSSRREIVCRESFFLGLILSYMLLVFVTGRVGGI